MALNGNVLAAEALAAMGGQQNDQRTGFFQKLMGAVVGHVRRNIPLPPPPYVAGDLFYASDANTLVRLPYPGNGQVLGGAGGVPAWQSGGGGGAFPVGPYSVGDIFYVNNSGIVTRLPYGADGKVLTGASGIPSWQPASGGGGGLTPTSKTSSYSAAAGDLVVVTSLSANVLVTLPSASSAGAGALVGVKDATMSAGGGTDGTGHILAVNSTSGNVEGVAQVYLMDDGASVTFISDGAGWWAIDGAVHVGIDPRGLSGLSAWWDFGRGYSLNSPGSTGSINRLGFSGLNDQSGNGYTLTFNSSYGTIPHASRGGLTGRGRAIFEGGSALVSNGNFTPPASTFTAFLVVQIPDLQAGAYGAMLGQNANSSSLSGFALFSKNNGTAANNPKMYISSEGTSTYANMGAFAGSEDIVDTPHCMAFTNSASAAYIHVDGMDATLTTPSTSVISSPTSGLFFVGQDHFNGGNADYFDGSISEIVLFFPGLSAAVAKQVAQSMMRKHRIRV